MDNLTFILREDGSRELVLQGTLYSKHLATFKAILTERPKDVHGVELWRAMRGRAKAKRFKPARNGRDLSEVIAAAEAESAQPPAEEPPVEEPPAEEPTPAKKGK